MATINMHDAKTSLSDLVARAEAGEDIIIARRNKPVVRLVPVKPVGEPPRRGLSGFGEPHHGEAHIGKSHFGGFAEEAQLNIDDLERALRTQREFVITQGGKPMAHVAPIDHTPKTRGLGAWKGRFTLPESFFDPLPDDELLAWEGGDEASS